MHIAHTVCTLQTKSSLTVVKKLLENHHQDRKYHTDGRQSSTRSWHFPSLVASSGWKTRHPLRNHLMSPPGIQAKFIKDMGFVQWDGIQSNVLRNAILSETTECIATLQIVHTMSNIWIRCANLTLQPSKICYIGVKIMEEPVASIFV
jgi:hypothetical protein